eukprot:TRINITY_DN6669_c0_g1_i1.p1 TRINITY_DN6669_c0_g1~~TRINITY_DN6669_c0_g1_i1.p1  ORF type:complete len:417 (+),score=64.32 TRINITY_DN6669_c0_g1_i1:63-1313(+)
MSLGVPCFSVPRGSAPLLSESAIPGHNRPEESRWQGERLSSGGSSRLAGGVAGAAGLGLGLALGVALPAIRDTAGVGSRRRAAGRRLRRRAIPGKVTLGTLEVSPMGIGMLNLPLDKTDDDNATGVMRAAGSTSINFIDTAEAYGFGKSEELTASALRKAGLSTTGPEGIAIATKFAPVPWRGESKSLVDACKASAARLGLESIPLYQIHFPDVIQPLKFLGMENRKDELYWDGLAEVYLSGLATNVGVSNYGPTMIRRVHAALEKRGVPLVSNQINFSLMSYKKAQATMEVCNELGIKILAYFPLSNGLLAGRYDKDNMPPFPKSLTMKKYVDAAEPLIEALKRVAAAREKTPAQVSLNWVMCKGAIPIPGARNEAMARDNAGALGWELTSDEVAELEAAAAKVTLEFNAGFKLE